MRIAIADVLTADDVILIGEALANARFSHGSQTAGFAARKVKDNQQADPTDRSLTGIRDLIAERILKNPVFQMAARPKQLSPLLLSRYDVGMQYGAHTDDALMQGMRTDIAFTIFLTDPVTYDGGELVIETADGNDEIKLSAGSMIVYPATSLHRVAEVSSGHRYVAAGWVRSFVRDPAQRELLFDLDTARRALFAREGKSQEFDLMSKTFANLLRMWCDD
jgi:PKHD-type hydroxylase